MRPKPRKAMRGGSPAAAAARRSSVASTIAGHATLPSPRALSSIRDATLDAAGRPRAVPRVLAPVALAAVLALSGTTLDVEGGATARTASFLGGEALERLGRLDHSTADITRQPATRCVAS